MGFNDYSNAIGNLVKKTQYAKFTDGTELCKRHFDDQFPQAWNVLIVNGQPWSALFNVKLVDHPAEDETYTYCTKCKEALRVPNNDEILDWTEAWAEVAQLIGMTIAIWILKRGGTGQAAMDNYPSNKPYPTFNLFSTKASFEKELRHQCYMILGHYHIKVSENDTKKWVHHLIDRTYEIFDTALHP